MAEERGRASEARRNAAEALKLSRAPSSFSSSSAPSRSGSVGRASAQSSPSSSALPAPTSSLPTSRIVSSRMKPKVRALPASSNGASKGPGKS
jgi:hypothetical protein